MEQTQILDTVTSGLLYTPLKEILAKPLEEVLIKKEIVKPVSTGEKDEDGIELTDSETSFEEVPTMFKKAIVLALPVGYSWTDEEYHPQVGDVVYYYYKHATEFDLFKDSVLINPYNVVAYTPKERYFKD